jgi:membrane protease YdiL (CAAX protease family)
MFAVGPTDNMNSENDNPNPLEHEIRPESPVVKPAEVPPKSLGSELAPGSEAWGPSTNLEGFRPIESRVPEDLRVPWGWWDLGLLALIAVSGILALGLLIIGAFQITGITRAQFEHSTKYQALASMLGVFLLSVFLLLYLALQLRMRFDAPFWRTLRWRPIESGTVPPRIAYFGFILSGFLLSMVIAFVSSAFAPKNKMPIEQFLQDRQSAFLLLVMSVTLAPFFEETIFRGYIYPVVARTFGVIPGVLFTGLIFGLLHASQLGGNVPQVALLATVGIVFTAVRAKTGSVLPGFLVHVSYNSFISIAFLIGSHGLRHMPHG